MPPVNGTGVRKEGRNTVMKRFAVVAGLAGLLLGLAGPAFADAPPPTNGGNGGGQSGQCTGDPDSRPASCGP